MNRKKNLMLIDSANPDVIRVGILNQNNQLIDIDYHTKFSYNRGSIHIGVIEKIFPSLQAVFVKYKDSGKNGFLPFCEIDEIYFSDNIENNEDTKDLVDEISDSEMIEQDLIDYSANLDLIDLENNTNAKNYVTNRGFLCTNQQIIVQVIKEERGTKGAMLSTFIHLNGKFCTFIPNRSDKTTVSQHMSINLIDKKRLQLLLQNIEIPKNSSVIINQNCFNASKSEIEKDIFDLSVLWNDVKNKASLIINNKNIEPKSEILHYDFNLMQEIFQNRHLSSFYLQNIIIEGKESYEEALDFAKKSMSPIASMIKFHDIYEEKMPIFSKYGIEKAVENAFSPLVSLRSGGYIVINKTEALIAIDVNSGKNRDEVSIEETALKTNIEAIQEIMHQIKIRKLSGLIVIDLIGMKDFENNKTIEGIAWRIIQNDRVKIQLVMVPEFSMLILSKQRLENSLHEICEIPCHYCNGTGSVKDIKFTINELFNNIRHYINNYNSKKIKIFVEQSFFEVVMNDYRDRINDFEKQLNCKIIFLLDLNLKDLRYKIEKPEAQNLNILQNIEKNQINTEDKLNIKSKNYKIIEEELKDKYNLSSSKNKNTIENNNQNEENLQSSIEKSVKNKLNHEITTVDKADNDNYSEVKGVWNSWINLNFGA
jgi:ribonuclease E